MKKAIDVAAKAKTRKPKRSQRAHCRGILQTTITRLRKAKRIVNFMNTEMDYLILGNFILERAAQPPKALSRRFELQPD